MLFRFGTVGSPISTPKKPGGSVGATHQIADLGLSALELGWVRSVRVSDKTCAAIKAAAKERNVAISVHAPYYINLNADDDEWPKSRQRLMDAAHFGNLAGATDIIFHPGSYFGKPAAEVLPQAIDSDSFPWVRIRCQHPGYDCIAHPDDLEQFSRLARQTINHVQDVMNASKVHLVAVSPASTVYRFGQMLQAGHHPSYFVYDRADRDTQFTPVLEITGQCVSAIDTPSQSINIR